MVDVAGDLGLYAPGDEPDVAVVADANGNVPQRGDPVSLAGESSNGTHVTTVSEIGGAVGTLKSDLLDYDENATYSEDDLVGMNALLLREYVDWWPVADSYTPSVDDLVTTDADGNLIAYDDTPTADGGAGHTPNMIKGRVFRTRPDGDYRLGKAAIARS